MNQEKAQHISLTVSQERIESCTTLLQSGIAIECPAGTTLGVFLGNLPGFDADYIVNRIQTIFLDGNAIDNMETVFNTPAPILALSAAMPGLAGAIFRKNSLHAALRTVEIKATQVAPTSSSLIVLLKLFNVIAIEKGPRILEKGGVFPGKVLLEFFQQRPSLQDAIMLYQLDDKPTAADTFWNSIAKTQNYFVTIQPARG